MFVSSLKDAISEALAKQIVFSADSILREYALGHLKSLEETYEAIRSLIISTLGGQLETLPTELVQSLAEQVQEFGSCSIVPVLTLMSFACKRIDFGSITCPPELLCFCMRHLSAGVDRIDFSANMRGVELLESLAASPAAATLRTLRSFFECPSIRDGSSDVWKRFSMLEKIVLDSPFLTRKTLDEILALRHLRSLSFRSDGITGREIAERAIEKAVKLDVLMIDLPEAIREAELIKLIDLFKKNPQFAHNLRRLEFPWQTPFEGDYHEMRQMKDRLLEACPNLVAIPSVFPVHLNRIRTDARPSLREFVSYYDEEIMSQSDIDHLASTCPDLKTLSLNDADFRAGELSKFSALTNISLNISSPQAPLSADIRFPQQLRVLLLDVRGGLVTRTGAPCQDSLFNAFLIRISTQLPNLEELFIKTPHVLEKSAFLHLTSAMTNLASLTISRYGDDNVTQSEDFVVCNHPKLKSWPLIVGATFTSKPGYLPRLKYLYFLDSTIDNPSPKTEIGSPSRFPRLRTLDLPRALWDFEFVGGLKLLESLALIESGWSPYELPILLPKLTNLQEVRLSGYSVTTKFCSNLVKKLTRLQTLTICEAKRDDTFFYRSLDWVNASALLQVLNLDHLGLSLEEPDQLDPIVFSGKNLPFLTEVTLTFANAHILCPSITLTSLLNLKVLSISSANVRGFRVPPAPVDISFVDCPNIREIVLVEIGLSSLILTDATTRLDSLCISSCRIVVSASPENDDSGLSLPAGKFIFPSNLPLLSRVEFAAWMNFEDEERGQNDEAQQVELLRKIENLVLRVAPHFADVPDGIICV